jgi:hypothetical protein
MSIQETVGDDPMTSTMGRWRCWQKILGNQYSPYPLVNVYITMERSTMFNGKIIPLFLWAMFNSYVKLPEGH